MTEAPKILLAHHLKILKLPTFLREYEKVAQPGGVRRQIGYPRAFGARGAAEGLDHVQFLARLVEMERIDRERRMIERRSSSRSAPADRMVRGTIRRRRTPPNSRPPRAWTASTSRRSRS